MWLREVDEESAEVVVESLLWGELGLMADTFLLGFWWEKDDLLRDNFFFCMFLEEERVKVGEIHGRPSFFESSNKLQNLFVMTGFPLDSIFTCRSNLAGGFGEAGVFVEAATLTFAILTFSCFPSMTCLSIPLIAASPSSILLNVTKAYPFRPL